MKRGSRPRIRLPPSLDVARTLAGHEGVSYRCFLENVQPLEAIVDIEVFAMERMQCLYENEVEYNLSESGVQPLTVAELLEGEDLARLVSVPLGYPHSDGTLTLRERIAAFYPGAGAENVTVMNGGSEVNHVTLWTLLEPRGRLAFMVPNYMQGWGLGRHYGAGSDAFRLVVRDQDGGRWWALDIDELQRTVTADKSVILVTNPNNPTGAVLTEKEMAA